KTLYVKIEVPFRKRLRLYEAISDETKRAAFSLMRATRAVADRGNRSDWKQHLHWAFRRTALPLDLLDTNSVATYIGALSERQLDSLRFNNRPLPEVGLEFDRIVLSWTDFIRKRGRLNNISRLVVRDPKRLLVSARLFNRKGEGPAIVEQV